MFQVRFRLNAFDKGHPGFNQQKVVIHNFQKRHNEKKI